MSHEIDDDLSIERLDLGSLGLSEEFTPEKHLTGPDEIASYLTEILEDDNFAQFNEALNVIARSEGAPKIAALAGMTREGLYKALRGGSKPRFETVKSILNAIGMDVVVKPKAQNAGYRILGAELSEYTLITGNHVTAMMHGVVEGLTGVTIVSNVSEDKPVTAKRIGTISKRRSLLKKRKEAQKSRQKVRSYGSVAKSDPEVIMPYEYHPAC